MKKILLTEGSSLTARETLTALRNSQYQVDIMTSERQPMTKFSRWRHQLIPTFNVNEAPEAYLSDLVQLVNRNKYTAILPTHEEAWLIAEALDRLPDDFPVAVAPACAFRQTQSKIAFAELLDTLHLPQPAWRLLKRTEKIELPMPFWVKAEYGTAGQGVRRIQSIQELEQAFKNFPKQEYNRFMIQEHIEGRYGQIQALFAHGRMLAIHMSLQVGRGYGNSSAARKSVYLLSAYQHMEKIGSHLNWHGPITIDFIFKEGQPYYIECNPRMVEPANAEWAGVNFPELLIQLTEKQQVAERTQKSIPGLNTHSLEALLMGSAEKEGKRGSLLRLMCRKIFQRNSREIMTPINDLPSLIPLLFVAGSLLINPQSVNKIADRAIRSYSVYPETILKLKDNPSTIR